MNHRFQKPLVRQITMIKQTFLATSVIGIIAFVTGCSGDRKSVV